MSGGRPSKYDPAFCDEVRDFLKDGYSVAAFAGHIGVSYSTVKLWMADHDEFSAAVKDAQASATLWWENRARDVAMGAEVSGNPTIIIFGLKNRAASEWKDKTEQEHSGVVTVQKIERAIVDSPNRDS
jgi:hypothetical protein